MMGNGRCKTPLTIGGMYGVQYFVQVGVSAAVPRRWKEKKKNGMVRSTVFVP